MDFECQVKEFGYDLMGQLLIFILIVLTLFKCLSVFCFFRCEYGQCKKIKCCTDTEIGKVVVTCLMIQILKNSYLQIVWWTKCYNLV